MGHDIKAPRIEREDMTRREAVLAAVYLPVHAVLLPRCCSSLVRHPRVESSRA